MNYDIIKTFNLKYELIDKEKSFSFYNKKEISHIKINFFIKLMFTNIF